MPKIKQTIIALNDVLSFGKYKGKTLEYVVKFHPAYIEWLDKEKIAMIPVEFVNQAVARRGGMRLNVPEHKKEQYNGQC